MCKIMEDMRNESLKEAALRMLAAGKYALFQMSAEKLHPPATSQMQTAISRNTMPLLYLLPEALRRDLRRLLFTE